MRGKRVDPCIHRPRIFPSGGAPRQADVSSPGERPRSPGLPPHVQRDDRQPPEVQRPRSRPLQDNGGQLAGDIRPFIPESGA